MRFSIRVNNDLKLPEFVSMAQAAEAAGFDQFWVSNDLFLRSAPVILAAIGEATSRIEVGSSILNPYTINPAELAMLAATMDELTGNRFNLGLSSGASDFLSWVGIEQSKPLTALREVIAAIRGLLAGERAAVDGTFLHWSEDAYLRFEAPRVTPIYVGALGPNMLRLAGEVADGVLPLLFPPEHYYDVQPYLQEGIARRSPELGELDFAACIWASIGEDAAETRRVLAEKIAYYGPHLSPMLLERLGLVQSDFDAIQRAVVAENDLYRAAAMVTDDMLAIGVVGSPDDVIARLEPLVAAGATHLSFGPPLGPDPLAAIELMGKTVIPHFRSGA